MGKHGNKNSMVAPRRRLMKASSGAASKKSRASAKVSLPPPPPPPPQSLVVDEDSGFGDQSLDSESSLLSAPAPSAPSVPQVLPSLAMVPQAKLLLVSLLQGAGGVQGAGTSQKTSGNLAVGAYPPSTPVSVSNGTSQTGSTPCAVMCSGADMEGEGCPRVRPLLAAAPLQGADAQPEVPAASNCSPSTFPTQPVPLGSTGHKVLESHLSLPERGLHVELAGDEAQELPASRSSTTTSVPSLLSFRDVSLLSSLHPFKGSNSSSSSSSGGGGGGGSGLMCVERPVAPRGRLVRSALPHNPPPLNTQLSPRSSDGSIELKLVSQPEEQHRARYQTEGSRGAVKDRSGSSHPTVQLTGYNKPTTIQVFVGCDSGRTGPHMFYQVCRVSGKSSTPCKERRIDGTAVIEASLNPCNNMTMSCDCVGILKERNVDVEHRFKAAVSRGRKKSTKCRLVFRSCVTLPSGAQETLQVVSQPIACTQPPGVPEICRKSVSKCSVTGGEEMFIFGKNFLKDTVVIFQQRSAKAQPVWEEKVLPDKDTLQPIHLLVEVPKYCDQSIGEAVSVEVTVLSGGKTSEPHTLTYLPLVTKKELPNSETWDDKPLPKGVSPCALQLNRHYAETGTLPLHLPEVSAGCVPPAAVISSTPVSTSTAVRTSRVMLSSNKRTSPGRAARLVTRSPKAAALVARRPSGASVKSGAEMEAVSAQPENSTDAEEGQKKAVKAEGVQGSVSIESLVEMLKVVQKFPAGSNLHTSVLQLVEELIKSMKESICLQAAPCKTEVLEEPFLEEPAVEKPGVLQAPAAGRVTYSASTGVANTLSASYLYNRSPKVVHHVAPQSHMSVINTTSAANSVTIGNSLGILPLTLFPAMTPTFSGSPRVARVTPVAPVAPTTVVSSAGLTRNMRVCVPEVSMYEEGPPAKKKREEEMVSMDYQLVRPGQYEPGTLVASQVVTSTPTTSSSLSQATPILTHKVTTQCGSGETVAAPPQAISPGCENISIASSEVLTQTPLLTVANTASTMTQQERGIFQPLLHGMTAAAASPDTTVVGSQHETPVVEVSQPALPAEPHSSPLATAVTWSMPEQQRPAIHSEHGNLTAISVETGLPAAVTTALLSQDPRVCTLLPSTAVVPSTSQESPLPPTSSATLAVLARSDPLLSQSSPVSSMPMETNSGLAGSREEGPSSRGDPLLTGTAHTAQSSMQNEVTSAINLSETEFLKFFDPNCFDNV